ncbi:MAG: methionyl-tRNA formyltransferase [Planctomycetota bacterium]|jgi:methionyl-tRNA formyltransferase|nr:methionyl-tRNA formyltransferase [Planctomycetota bacterium]
MKIVFFGSGEFGIPALENLIRAGHEIPAVVSQPDRPAGRGGKTRPTPLREKAEEMGLAVTCPEKPNTPEFEAELRAFAPDLCVVVAYGHLIKKPLLAVPEHGFVNLHASLLPAYRGAAPVPWAILKGESVSGVSVFQLDERFDTGAVIATASLPILDADTSGTYLARLAPLGGRLMEQAVEDIAAGRAAPQPQDHARASAAPKFSKEDGRIDWNLSFAEIERKVRAFQPWPQAFAMLPTAKGDVRVNIVEMAPAPAGIDASGAAPGAILAADGKTGLVIATGDKPARLTRLQPEGKRAMTDTDFVRGTKIQL